MKQNSNICPICDLKTSLENYIICIYINTNTLHIYLKWERVKSQTESLLLLIQGTEFLK